MDAVFKILEELNYKISYDLKKYYSKINIWRYYWKGYDPEFHKYQAVNVRKEPVTLKRKSLKMGKKVCEDWASLLLNDKTYIIVDDDKSQELLAGDKETQHGGTLGRSKFWKQGNRAVEKEYALGTAVFYLDLVNPKVENSTHLKADNVRIRYIKDPKQFIPIGWDNDEITECAIYSYHVKGGKEYIHLQTFIVENDEYRVTNYRYQKENEKYIKVELDNDTVEWYKLPCKPFFVLTPNLENNFLDDIPMGMSVFANAIHCLQLCDISFDNLYTDFYLGRKKIFMDQDIMATEETIVKDTNGNNKTIKIPRADKSLDQSLYVSVGNRLPGEKKMFEEYNPTLRVTENKEGIQFALDLLSSKVGFGQNRYQFQMQSMATATQARISKGDQTESVWKQRINIEEVLIEMTHSILVIQKEMCNLPVNPDAKISIKFDDTMFTDEEAERVRDLNDVNAGLMAKWEYRVKWYQEDEKTAKKIVAEIEDDPGLSYGDLDA